jgi:uroporphyrinogen decarboxylase
MHFGSEHLAPRETARLHARFQAAYGWDVLKAMADYHFPLPDGVLAFDSAGALARLRPPTADSPCFRDQYGCLGALLDEVGTQVPVLDSGYDPYHLLLRHIGHDQAAHLRAHERLVRPLLQALCDATCEHIARLKSLGVTGYFHATVAAIPEQRPRGVSDEVFEDWVRPHDLAILRAAEGMVRVLHAHGDHLRLERLRGYPHEAISLSVHAPGNPGIQDLAGTWPAALMLGIDEGGFTAMSRAGLALQIEAALQATPQRRLVLAPGCVLPPSSSASSLRFLRAHAQALGREPRP